MTHYCETWQLWNTVIIFTIYICTLSKGRGAGQKKCTVCTLVKMMIIMDNPLQFYPFFVFTYSTIHNLCLLTVLSTICVYLQYYPQFVFAHSAIHCLCLLQHYPLLCLHTVLSTCCFILVCSFIHGILVFTCKIFHHLCCPMFVFACSVIHYLCYLQHCVWLCWRSLRVHAP